MKAEQRSADFTSEKRVYIGLDVHRKTYQARALVDGEVLQRWVRLPADAEGLMRWTERHYGEAEVIFGYEAGFCGLELSRTLQAGGYVCKVLNPADIPSTNRERVHKNDGSDSGKIARALASPDTRYNYQLDREAERLRQNVRAGWDYNGQVRHWKHRIVMQAHYLGLRLPSTEQGHYSWSRASRMQFQQQVQTDGRLDLVLSLESLDWALQQQQRYWAALDEQLRHSRYSKLYGLLQTVPGIGPLLSAVLTTEIVDMDRFASGHHLRQYIGLVPSESSSGEREQHGRISRRGNALLRWAFVQAAWRAVDCDSELCLRYVAWKKRGLDANKAIVKLACLLIERVRAVWRSGQPYQTPTPRAAPDAQLAG